MTWTIPNAALLFLALLIVLRVTGKRELAQMSPFDLVMLYVIGDVTAEAVVGEDTSFIGAMSIVSVLTLLTVLVSWISYRFPRSRTTLDGLPCVVVRDGVPNEVVMRREHLTEGDIDAAARSQGIRDLGDVELAILEQSGQFSFFTRS